MIEKIKESWCLLVFFGRGDCLDYTILERGIMALLFALLELLVLEIVLIKFFINISLTITYNKFVLRINSTILSIIMHLKAIFKLF